MTRRERRAAARDLLDQTDAIIDAVRTMSDAGVRVHVTIQTVSDDQYDAALAAARAQGIDLREGFGPPDSLRRVAWPRDGAATARLRIEGPNPVAS